jgi:hypothetical protein
MLEVLGKGLGETLLTRRVSPVYCFETAGISVNSELLFKQKLVGCPELARWTSFCTEMSCE